MIVGAVLVTRPVDGLRCVRCRAKAAFHFVIPMCGWREIVACDAHVAAEIEDALGGEA